MSESSVASVPIQKAQNGRHVDFTFRARSFPIHPGTKQRERSRSKLKDYPRISSRLLLRSDMIKAKVTGKKKKNSVPVNVHVLHFKGST